MTTSARPTRSTTHQNGRTRTRPRVTIVEQRTSLGPLYLVSDAGHVVCRTITRSHAERVCQQENDRKEATR